MAIELPIFNSNIIEIGIISIKYYSLAYIFGIIFAWIIMKYINNNLENKIFVDKDGFLDNMFSYIIFGIILGGRLGYVLFYNFKYYSNNILDIFKIWNGGMSFHGGFIGVCIAIILFSKKYKLDLFRFSDLIAVVSPIGLFLGRIANFINLELYGKETNVPWAMIFPFSDGKPRHPSQLYEALLEGLILFLILFFTAKKTKLKYKCLTTSLFFILYSSFRFLLEFCREPDVQIGYILKYFTMGQILSVIMFMFGIYFLIKCYKLNKPN